MTAQEELSRRISRDGICRAVQKKIDEGKADFADTARYTDRAAELLGMVLSEYVPDMPPDERETLCKGLLRQRYLDTNAMLNAVQRTLDAVQGLHLAPQIADYPEERVDQAAHSLADETVPVETIVRRAKSAPATIARSFQDDYIEKNAAFRSSAGLKCYINRIAAGGCCKWCTAMAGRYRYGEEPGDIYRRHDNCSCTVTYESGRKRQDVWSKREWEAPEPGAGAGDPVVLTKEQARELEANAQLRALVYDMANPVKASREKDITLHRVTTAHNALYVSDGAREMAKPKIIHQIDMRVSEAMKLMGIQDAENLPAIYVIDGVEMAKSTVAAYNAIENVLFVNIGTAVYSKGNMPDVMKAFACGEDDRSSYVHELLHWKDAQKFHGYYGKISDDNYSQYVQFINSDAKKKLDKLIENGYNIADISTYALDEMASGRYYETETEYRVKQILRGG